MRTRVRASLEAPIFHRLPQMGSSGSQSRNAIDDVHDEVEAIEIIEHDHVERRRRRALLLVSPHVQVPMVGAAVREAVDQPRVPVIGEDAGPPSLGGDVRR